MPAHQLLRYLCLPKYSRRRRRPPLSGWNNSTNTLKQEAHFWHRVWTECGCPTSGVLFQIKKHSKRRFKYEVRRQTHKRRQNYIHRENLAASLSSSSTQEFGSKLRNFPSPPERLLHPLVLLMAVAMSQIFRTFFHPSSSLFLTLTPIVSLAPVCSNISVTPLTLLSLLSVCLRRQCVMPSLNLSLVSVMVPLFLPTILSMLKKFFVSIYLSCLLP